MKSPSLDYRRLADYLIDKGLIDRATANHVLQQCDSTGALMPEILVTDSLVSDWEVARVCAELFHLPYLPVECYPPNKDALEGLNADYLRQYGLVPLDRFGSVLTVAMPGVVPSGILDDLVGESGTKVIPVVGSVKSNRNWLDQNLDTPASASLEAFSEAFPEDESEWANLFDDADQAVQLDLNGDS